MKESPAAVRITLYTRRGFRPRAFANAILSLYDQLLAALGPDSPSHADLNCAVDLVDQLEVTSRAKLVSDHGHSSFGLACQELDH